MEPICATCRDESGICPGCRLERRMKSAGSARPGLGGNVGPSNPPPGPGRAPQYEPQSAPVSRPSGALAAVSPETRALLGLGYPLWPLAVIALLDPKRSPAVRRQSVQALALNGGMFCISTFLTVLAHFWFVISWPAFLMLPFVFPVWFVATVIYGFKAWQGEDVRVPLVSDWLDERERAHQHMAA
jgi:uncharacterized membrane protein